MVAFGWTIFFVAVVTILAFNRASLMVWTIGLGVYLTLVSIFCQLGTAGHTILWLLWAAFALINVLPLRRRLFSNRILKIYRKLMPKMSTTEEEALSAGTVGWEGEMFNGIPDWNKLQKMPKAKLSTEERDFLEGPVEELCGMVNNWEINHRLFEVPASIWDFLKKHGFFGLIIPKKYGGKEFFRFGSLTSDCKNIQC